MKHLGDVQKIHGYDVPAVDIIVGGSPCQSLSVAGLRHGIKHKDHGDDTTTRSGLAYDMFRIIKEMRNREDDRGTAQSVRHPRYALWENVPGSLSATAGDSREKGTAFQCVLTEFVRCLEEEAPPVPIPAKGWPNAGAIVFNDGKSSLAWRIIDAQYFGVPQRRRRIALLCDFDGLSAPSILFEQYTSAGCGREVQAVCEGLQRDTDPCKQTEEDTSGAVGESTSGYD